MSISVYPLSGEMEIETVLCTAPCGSAAVDESCGMSPNRSCRIASRDEGSELIATATGACPCTAWGLLTAEFGME